ncbi:MAG: hypothetical protein A2X94_01555 [Bdellovibrionales bacterium GWB1_55_8]|nr:MAG: hypothetical protein A2X94_01555 [Bdellovibrionales bacterium GWB1_55_8]
MQIRVGVHLGDVVVSGGDVYGDGVNIAARLQYVARPGGICMSGSVFYQVDHKLDIPVEHRGARQLKNIKNPVAVYEIRFENSAIPATPRVWFNRRAFNRRILKKAGIAVATAALILGVLWQFQLARERYSPDIKSRIAVLPFENISHEGEDDAYLSNGLTEELISSLSRSGDLRVLARTAVMQYKSSDRTAGQIGKDLQVGYLIQGSVRTLGQRVRISVQFIDVASQESRWSQVYEGELNDIFGLQKTIAGEVSRQFRGRSPASTIGNRPDPDPTPNSEAYLIYLKARYFIEKRTEEGLKQGMELLKKAVAIDPHFSSAYAAMASAASLRSFYGGASPQTTWNEVFLYADRALELNPGSTDALLSLAEGKLYFTHDWSGAEDRYRRAIASNPDDPTAHQWYAEFLAYMKRPSEADMEIQTALRLAPLSLIVKSAAANVAYFSGNYEAAVRHCQSAIEMNPAFMLPHYWAGRAYIQLGKSADAIQSLQRAADLSGGESMMLSALAQAYALSGETAQARQILSDLLKRSKKRYVSAYDIATLHAALGDTDQALTFLENGIEERASHMVLVANDPVFNKIRNHQRFRAVLGALRLPSASTDGHEPVRP